LGAPKSLQMVIAAMKLKDDLCMAMAKLVPGVSCNIESLLKDAETAEKDIKETEQEARHLKDSMYR